jgi:hypothetical protein
MRHLGRISVASEQDLRDRQSVPAYAEAKVDLMNAMWLAWSDYYHQKKNNYQL